MKFPKKILSIIYFNIGFCYRLIESFISIMKEDICLNGIFSFQYNFKLFSNKIEFLFEFSQLFLNI